MSDHAPWPPEAPDNLTRLYNAEFEKTNCEVGLSAEEAHQQACKAIQKTGAPPPMMAKPSPSAVDQCTGMSRSEICDKLAAETVRRAVYEGAIRRIFEAVGAVTFETEEDPAQHALTEVYNICGFAIPGITGEEVEDDEDGLICNQQEEYRRVAHDAPHDDLAGDLLYFAERHKMFRRQAEKRCKRAQRTRDEACQERDTALRRAARLQRERDVAAPLDRLTELQLDAMTEQGKALSTALDVRVSHINELEHFFECAIAECHAGNCASIAVCLQDGLGLLQRSKTATTPPPRIPMLERAFDSVYSRLCELEISLGEKATKEETMMLHRAIENCKYKKEPEFSNKFGKAKAEDVSLAVRVRREAEARGPLPADVVGGWPGDETDEELLEALGELDQKPDDNESQKSLEALHRGLETLACPITGDKFFMLLERDGMALPTFGGPYDSYTLPTRSSDGDYMRLRYCHDRGQWIEYENLCVSVVTEEDWCELLDRLEKTPGAEDLVNKWLAEHQETETP